MWARRTTSSAQLSAAQLSACCVCYLGSLGLWGTPGVIVQDSSVMLPLRETSTLNPIPSPAPTWMHTQGLGAELLSGTRVSPLRYSQLSPTPTPVWTTPGAGVF